MGATVDECQRIHALASMIDVPATEIDAGKHGKYKVDGATYIICTDDEATTRARAEILGLVWAFRPEFLESHSKVASAEVFRAIQDNGNCEDNNEVILRLIDDVDHFVDDAILGDGRGHFLATYDGEELNTTLVMGGRIEWFVAYRVD